MTTITLTPEQLQLIDQACGQPVRVEDPTERRTYHLVEEAAQEARKAPDEAGRSWDDIPEGILRSQDAFFRDLPELLKDESLRGLWVIYHGDERIGVATKQAAPDRGVLEARPEEGRVRRLRDRAPVAGAGRGRDLHG